MDGPAGNMCAYTVATNFTRSEFYYFLTERVILEIISII